MEQKQSNSSEQNAFDSIPDPLDAVLPSTIPNQTTKPPIGGHIEEGKTL